jgi:hypothetical protein
LAGKLVIEEGKGYDSKSCHCNVEKFCIKLNVCTVCLKKKPKALFSEALESGKWLSRKKKTGTSKERQEVLPV